MKYLLLLFLLGCSHNTSVGIEDLTTRVDYLSYEQVNLQCFNKKDLCNLYATDYCMLNAESNKLKQCLRQTHNKCWKKHEICIIDNYKRYQLLKKHRKNQK